MRKPYKLFTKLPEGVGKTAWLSRIRVTTAQQVEVHQRAADCGLPVGEYMLRAALAKQTRSHVEATIINELRLIGNSIKDLHQAFPGAPEQEMRRLLTVVIEAIQRVGQGRVGE